ncbi:MAG: efflux RND transporter periplasmic adaptor subunit, partial [Pseudomonadota bacterium]|nr:efflux RND transporter periplasmic adaptor subunit [Pseudomonadota bacterium]
HAAAQAPGARPATATPPDGQFRVTAQQAANLHILPVQMHVFRNEVRTEGKIALDADRQTQVYSPYSGRVLKVLVSPGDRVRQGAALLDIEASEFVQAQNDLLAGAAAAHSASSQLALAHGVETRRHALYEARGGSLQDWQQSQNDVVVAEAALRSAETATALARNRLHILGKTDADITRIEAQGAIDPRTQVSAPIAGVVTDRQVGVGQFVQAGSSTPLFTIGDLSRVWLVGQVRENEAPALRPGQLAEVRVAALPGQLFRARISFLAPSVDPATHRLTVRAEVANPGGLLRPEMFASFTIVTGGEASAPAVPQDAVIRDGDHARVWLQDKPDLLVAREVRIGRTRDGLVEVLEGVRSGDRLVTSGTLFIDRAGTAE